MEELPDRYKNNTELADGFPPAYDQKNRPKLYNTFLDLLKRDQKSSSSDKSLWSNWKTMEGLFRKAKSFFAKKMRLPELNGSFVSKFRYMTQYFDLPKIFGIEGRQKIRNKSSNLNSVDDEIIQKLQDDISSQAPRKKIKNHKSNYLGTIQKLTYDDENNIRYIILHCTNFFGKKDRYFAIPLSPALIKLTEKGSLIIKLDKDQLRLAKGITAKKRPNPSLEFGQSIYELYNFNEATQKE